MPKDSLTSIRFANDAATRRRILQKRNSPGTWDDRLRFETVLAMKKGEATP